MPIRNLNSLKHFWPFLLLAVGIGKGWAAEPLMAAQISAGYSHTLAVDQSGAVYGWGSNEFGQTGDGTTVQRTQPVAVNAIRGTVSQVAAGDAHSLALLADGTVLAWGFNGNGQLGDNTTILRLTPVPTTTMQLTPGETTTALSGVLALSAGLYHSLALKNDGSVLSWGRNNAGQLGINTIVDAKQATVISTLTGRSITAIASGHNHNLALRSDGAVYAWGANESGQLGDGKSKNLPIPTQITTLFSNIVAIAAGAKHSLALRHDGTVWAWGGNNAGQLGDATSTTRLTPVHVSVLTGIIAIAANGEHSLALDDNGNVWAWGNNETGQLGDGTTISEWTPKQIKSLSGVHAISVGTAHSAAILNDSRALTWGSNWQGQLGNGTVNKSFSLLPAVIANIDLAPTALPPVPGIAAGDSHTLVVGPSGSVAYGWGGNEFGQVGDGTMVIKTKPVAVSNLPRISNWLAAGDVHSLALLPDGTVRAWGFNGNGQLGDNTLTLSLTPVVTTTTQITSAVPPVTSNGALSGVTAIAAGLNHSLALKNDGSLLSWGRNASGQLGIGSVLDAKQATVLPVLAGQPLTAISAGPNHSLALRHDGTVYAWGINESGQLGDGKTKNLSLPFAITTLPNNVVALAAGANHSLALRNNGTVWAWGGNSSGQLGDASTRTRPVPVLVSGLTNIIAIAANGEHSLALHRDGSVWAWGNNLVGQLGDCPPTTTTTNRSTPGVVHLMVGALAIAAGTAHSAAILVDKNSVASWGANWFGQLGDGTITTHRSCPVLPVDLGLSSVMVFEYYHSGLDHYFITANLSEASGLDANPSWGWVPTHHAFKSGGSSAVCRFYGSQSPGPNSHFYTVSADECVYLKQLQAGTPATEKRWNFELDDFLSTPPSVSGACPDATLPVYRAYNRGVERGIDSNHRITASVIALKEVLDRGWINEGVVMCAPL